MRNDVHGGGPLWRQGPRRIVDSATTRVAGRPALRRNAGRAMKGLNVVYAAFVEPWWISTTYVDIPVPGLPPELDGYRVVHLTDIHHNVISGAKYLRSVVARANALDPDATVITGDFVTHDPRRMPEAFALLAGLRAPDGVYATRGNHDFGVPLDTMRSIARRSGMHLLENEHRVLAPARRRFARAWKLESAWAPRIVLAGVSDLWMGHPNPTQALHGAPDDAFRMLLSHNPHVGEIVVADHRIALQLSGHTHGGQVRPFQKALKLLEESDGKYTSGLVAAPHTMVYVSRGVGTSALRMRWNCRPEIALVTLRAVASHRSSVVGE